jgi:hypothetical protein
MASSASSMLPASWLTSVGGGDRPIRSVVEIRPS